MKANVHIQRFADLAASAATEPSYRYVGEPTSWTGVVRALAGRYAR
jgi:hypothetical protein